MVSKKKLLEIFSKFIAIHKKHDPVGQLAKLVRVDQMRNFNRITTFVTTLILQNGSKVIISPNFYSFL